MRQYTFVTESHTFNDDKEMIEVLEQQDVRSIIQEELLPLIQGLGIQDKQARAMLDARCNSLKQELQQQKEALGKRAECLEQKVDCIEKHVQAVKEQADGEEKRLRQSLEKRLDRMAECLPRLVQEVLAPHFSHLATAIRQLQKEEERIKAMHEAIHSELATAQAIAEMFCRIQREEMQCRQQTIGRSLNSISELQNRLAGK